MHSRTKFRVRYAETDCMGIVHHSNYPIWYEMGRGDYVKCSALIIVKWKNREL